jgi:hypothetical protein
MLSAAFCHCPPLLALLLALAPQPMVAQQRRAPWVDEEGSAEEIFLDEYNARNSVSASMAIARGYSVLRVNNFVDDAECDALVLAARHSASPNVHTQRLNIVGFVGPARSMGADILRRTLAYVESNWPLLAMRLFNVSAGLHRLHLRCEEPQEPAVNVYSKGGRFARHMDAQHLTVLVPLSHVSTYGGGGTAFWRHRAEQTSTSHAGGDTLPEPDLVLSPPAGTALMWAGNVLHAARPVLEGVRMACVSSFNGWRPEAPETQQHRAHALLGVQSESREEYACGPDDVGG